MLGVGSRSDNAVHLLDLLHDVHVVGNISRTRERDVSLRDKQAIQNILALSLAHRHGHDERRHAGAYTKNRDQGDQRNHRLFALGSKVTGCNEKFEGHGVVWERMEFKIESRSSLSLRSSSTINIPPPVSGGGWGGKKKIPLPTPDACAETGSR